jgi:hypothetical protein
VQDAFTERTGAGSRGDDPMKPTLTASVVTQDYKIAEAVEGMCRCNADLLWAGSIGDADGTSDAIRNYNTWQAIAIGFASRMEG